MMFTRRPRNAAKDSAMFVLFGLETPEMIRILLALGAVLALAACAEDVPTMKWSKAGATYEQFVADRAVCVTRSETASNTYYVGGVRHNGNPNVLDAGVFLPCMNSLGYSSDPKGYAAPPGDEIPLGP